MIEAGSERPAILHRYVDVLDRCQDVALIFSSAQLAELFEHAGTALLDFAERAETNSMQSGFFEALGLIQRRRADMERLFRREIDRGFESFRHSSTALPGTDSDDATARDLELSLVGQDEMEESVAAENLVIKANASFSPELYALSQRLAAITGGKKLKDCEIPAGPHHLVQAFRHSMAELEVEVRIKVILYALFDKFVVKQAKGLYDELNGTLKDAGILPNVKPAHTRPEPSRGHRESIGGRQARNREAAPADLQAGADPALNRPQPTSLGAELFDSIVELMSTRRIARSGKPARATSVEPAAAAAASRALVAAVTAVQSRTTPESVHTMVAEAARLPNLEIDTAFVQKVKATLGRERDQVLSQIDRDQLSPMNADLIDLIGMLFEYMLNDPLLPNLAKAVLSHLHTPYLKVALVDRRLLVDADHPARRLLNQMVEAGTLWVDENNPRQGIFPAIQRVVDRVLQELSDDIALFDQLLAFFEQSMEEQRRKTGTMERRTQEAARGREKLQLAKRRADQKIRGLLQRTPLPAPVTSFLSTTWLDRLVFILLRDKAGDSGDAWKDAVTTAEDLIALFQLKTKTAMLDAGTRIVPGLRANITEAVRYMGGYTHSTLDALLALLNAPETWQESCARAAAAQPATPATRSAPENLATQADTPTGLSDISAREQEVIKRLRKMKFGTWFEFTSGTGGVRRRIKLSWLSPLTATCMFVDRSGMQAEIKTLRELSHEMLSGRAKVIPRPKHPFIERALVSIRNMLQGADDTPSADEAPQQR